MAKFCVISSFITSIAKALGRNTAQIAAHQKLPWFMALLAAVFCMPTFAAVGDTLVYRLVNGYNRETVGTIRHAFAAGTSAQGPIVTVTVDNLSLGRTHTEIRTLDGQWLRHLLDSHGIPTGYEFMSALPTRLSPLMPGKSWSVRVPAKVEGGFRNRSVRIDGDIMGEERVRVPAGEFDTVKIRRIIYPGDAGDFKSETRIVEIDWYAPVLDRSVRTDTRSEWQEPCKRGYCTARGDWDVLELTEVLSTVR